MQNSTPLMKCCSRFNNALPLHRIFVKQSFMPSNDNFKQVNRSMIMIDYYYVQLRLSAVVSSMLASFNIA